MAKPIPITADDLQPAIKTRRPTTMCQRGAIPSAELVPMQFRMPPDFVRAFKQAALDRNLKLNGLLNECFQHFIKTSEG